jgi:hypothetical protein
MTDNNELTQLLKTQANIYDHGEEDTNAGELDAYGWNFFEVQGELVNKVKHLNEFDNDSVTARKAMMIGLNVLASPYVDEETAENLRDQMAGLAEGGV